MDSSFLLIGRPSDLSLWFFRFPSVPGRHNDFQPKLNCFNIVIFLITRKPSRELPDPSRTCFLIKSMVYYLPVIVMSESTLPSGFYALADFSSSWACFYARLPSECRIWLQQIPVDWLYYRSENVSNDIIVLTIRENHNVACMTDKTIIIFEDLPQIDDREHQTIQA